MPSETPVSKQSTTSDIDEFIAEHGHSPITVSERLTVISADTLAIKERLKAIEEKLDLIMQGLRIEEPSNDPYGGMPH